MNFKKIKLRNHIKLASKMILGVMLSVMLAMPVHAGRKYLHTPLPFKSVWLKIVKCGYKDEVPTLNKVVWNDIEKAKDLLPNMIRDVNLITYKTVEYNDYATSIQILQQSSVNFAGILYYITYMSLNKINRSEFCLFSSSIDAICSNCLYKNQPSNASPYVIIESAPDLLKTSFGNYFHCPTFRDANIGCYFRRIKVKPLAYYIKCNPGAALVSFVFEGLTEDGRWVLLDERVNINDLINSTGSTFYCKTKDEYYVAFRIKQLEPSSNGFWGFDLVTFDVHGDIAWRKNPDQESISLAADVAEGGPDGDYNPSMDMTDWMI